jgi:hypothetical protein
MANTKAVGVAFADPEFDSVQVGSSNAPIALTSSGVLNGSYATTSATSGDTRLSYNKLTFTSTGSGETLRAFSVVTGTAAATAGTINGAHISLSVDGSAATISGAANAIRATLGGSDATPGGTLAVIQLDTAYTINASLPATASFIRVSDSGSNTGEIPLLMNIETAPAATIAPAATSVTTVAKAIKVMIGGTVYYVPAYSTFA